MKIVTSNMLKFLKLVLIVILGVSYVQTTKLFSKDRERYTLGSEMNLRNGTAAGNETKSGNVTESTGTSVISGQKNSTDALGNLGHPNLAISQPPYTITTCDQVLLIPGQRILNFDDYCQKQDAFFTLSLYMINVFDGKDPNKLLQSMTLDRINHKPQHLPGAPKCIDFVGDKSRIAMCLDSKETVDQLIESFSLLTRCRLGDNLSNKGINVKILSEIVKNCGDKSVDQNKLNQLGLGDLAGNSTATANSTHGNHTATPASKYNPYYADLKVPGTS